MAPPPPVRWMMQMRSFGRAGNGETVAARVLVVFWSFHASVATKRDVAHSYLGPMYKHNTSAFGLIPAQNVLSLTRPALVIPIRFFRRCNETTIQIFKRRRQLLSIAGDGCDILRDVVDPGVLPQSRRTFGVGLGAPFVLSLYITKRHWW